MTISSTNENIRWNLIEGCGYDEDEIFLQYRKDYVTGKYKLGDLRLKYELPRRVYKRFNKQLRRELGVETRGGGNNEKYKTFFNIEKVAFIKSNFKNTVKPRKCFYLKYENNFVKGVGGFIDFYTPELISNIIMWGVKTNG